MEGEPLDEVQWRAPEWIQMFGLRTDNVLEYFSQSPFYDRSSNNQVLKMQSQFNENLHGRLDLFKELQHMKGIEFVVGLEREPDMWIIRKQNRLSPTEVRLLATYFVVNENIFMAPSIYSVVSSRLLSTTLALSKSLAKAASLPTYSPSQGYSYINDTAIAVTEESNTGTPVPSKPKGRTPANETNYSSPVATLTPSGASTSVSGSAGLDDRASDRAIERALAFTMANSTSYLDAPDKESSTGGHFDFKGRPVATGRRRSRKNIAAE
jgi:mediator of RNA polymerase II transcription subunit 6